MIVLNDYFKSSVIMSGWVIARDEVCLIKYVYEGVALYLYNKHCSL